MAKAAPHAGNALPLHPCALGSDCPDHQPHAAVNHYPRRYPNSRQRRQPPRGEGPGHIVLRVTASPESAAQATFGRLCALRIFGMWLERNDMRTAALAFGPVIQTEEAYETILSPARMACFNTVWYPMPCLAAICCA